MKMKKGRKGRKGKSFFFKRHEKQRDAPPTKPKRCEARHRG